jgi:hypothetical protein
VTGDGAQSTCRFTRVYASLTCLNAGPASKIRPRTLLIVRIRVLPLLPEARLFIRSVICIQRSSRAAKVVFVDLLLDELLLIFAAPRAPCVRHPDTVFLSYFSAIKSIVSTTYRQGGPG